MSTTDESEFPRHTRILGGRLRAMSNPVPRAQTPVLAADPALWTEDIEARCSSGWTSNLTASYTPGPLML